MVDNVWTCSIVPVHRMYPLHVSMSQGPPGLQVLQATCYQSKCHHLSYGDAADAVCQHSHGMLFDAQCCNLVCLDLQQGM